MTPAAEVRQLLGRAEYLAAFDAAEGALADSPGDAELEHLAVLSLARSGATDTAATRLHSSGLLDRTGDLPIALVEDVLALDARIAKDRAIAAPADQRAMLAAGAAERYEAIFRLHGRTYTGVNAASMWCVAGDLERARSLASEVLAVLDATEAPPDYWAAATRGECQLLLGNLRAASVALSQADGLDDDLANRASTRRQLALLCSVLGVDARLLDALPAPLALHFCGHLPSDVADGTGRLGPDDEARVAREVRSQLAGLPRIVAYGSLAAGGDIVVAEAVLATGGDLHVVLPFPVDEFVESSVAAAGRAWVTRFHECLGRATSVTAVTEGRHTGDDEAAYAYCSAFAMGSALVRARWLESTAVQLAVWDGQPTERPAGTASDVERWRATGRHTIVVPVATIPTTPAPRRRVVLPRRVGAILFADVKGFSALADRQIPDFVEHILGSLSRVLSRADPVDRNAWGDALFVVFDDVDAAAEAALQCQETMAALDLEAVGLPSTMQLRIGAHAGTVFVLVDPVRDSVSYFGKSVTQAARIEPVTPPGAVFVTEAFAALLTLARPDGYVCEYVGIVPSAKGYGEMPMYLLRRQYPAGPAQSAKRS